MTTLFLRRTVAVSGCLIVLPTVLVAQGTAYHTPLRVAVTPIVHEEIAPDTGQALAERLAEHIRSRNRDILVVGPQAATSMLAARGVAAAWGRVLFTFFMTGILDAVELRAVCGALNVDAILHAEIAALIEGEPRTVPHPYVVQQLRVEVRGWLFDCGSGRPMWERSGTGRVERIADSRAPDFSPSEIPASLPTARAIGDLRDALPPLDGIGHN